MATAKVSELYIPVVSGVGLLPLTPTRYIRMTGIPSDLDIDAFMASINSSGAFGGMKVVYWNGGRFIVIRPGPPICAPGLKTIVIKPRLGAGGTDTDSTSHQREGRLYQELFSAGLSCPAAAISWVVTLGGVAAVPLTGGASTFVSILGYGAAVASTVQCGNSLYRAFNEATEAYSENDRLDSEQWYVTTAMVLDAASLLGVAAAVGTTLRTVVTLMKSTGRPALQVVRGLSRPEGTRLARDLIRAQHPGISNKALKAFVRAGRYPKRYLPVQISSTVRTRLQDALGAALGFTGSATGGLVRSGAGYVAGIVEGIETF